MNKQPIDTFDSAKLRALARSKKRRSVSTLSILRPKGRRVEGVDLSIIILSFNTLELTRQCLETVYASKLGKYLMEVIVCDNNSKDGSIEMIKKESSKTILIENKKNLGFAAGNNPGIKRARGRYILLLNSDTEVSPSAFGTMIRYMDGNPDVGAATCKLVLTDGRIDPACHRGFPTPWAAFSYFLKLEKLFPKSQLFAKYHLGYLDRITIHEVDVISGAFFMVRREVIKQVGMLDEDYYFYGEDMDWCYRIKEAGWKIMYNPAVTVLHKKKQSGRAHTDRVRRVKTELFFYQYNKLFYQKNYDGKYSKLLMLLLYLLFDIRIFLLSKIKI